MQVHLLLAAGFGVQLVCSLRHFSAHQGIKVEGEESRGKPN